MCFSTPKGFGPIVTPVKDFMKMGMTKKEFQYPEGFWPDSDNLGTKLGLREDSVAKFASGFSTPKGFGPIVTILNS